MMMGTAVSSFAYSRGIALRVIKSAHFSNLSSFIQYNIALFRASKLLGE